MDEDDIRVRAIDAVRKGELYDFIAHNYWRFRKDELKDILLEVYYAATQGNPSENEIFGEDVASELEGRWDID